MFSVSSSTDFKNVHKYLEKFKGIEDNIDRKLHAYGARGVSALQTATPSESGKTARSWDYTVVRNKDKSTIFWTNSNTIDGVNIAVILQYGHATGTGGYVQGYDYINPAIKPIFDDIAEAVWYEIKQY